MKHEDTYMGYPLDLRSEIRSEKEKAIARDIWDFCRRQGYSLDERILQEIRLLKKEDGFSL